MPAGCFSDSVREVSLQRIPWAEIPWTEIPWTETPPGSAPLRSATAEIPNVDRQTPVKILPYQKFCMWMVIIWRPFTLLEICVRLQDVWLRSSYLIISNYIRNYCKDHTCQIWLVFLQGEIFKNLSVFLHHCTFLMSRSRVHSIKRELALSLGQFRAL